MWGADCVDVEDIAAVGQFVDSPVFCSFFPVLFCSVSVQVCQVLPRYGRVPRASSGK